MVFHDTNSRMEGLRQGKAVKSLWHILRMRLSERLKLPVDSRQNHVPSQKQMRISLQQPQVAFIL